MEIKKAKVVLKVSVEVAVKVFLGRLEMVLEENVVLVLYFSVVWE